MTIERDRESHSIVSDSLQPHGLYSLWNFPGQNSGVGSLSLFQRIFPTQESNPGLPHCRPILCQLSHKGSPYLYDHTVYYLFYLSNTDNIERVILKKTLLKYKFLFNEILAKFLLNAKTSVGLN